MSEEKIIPTNSIVAGTGNVKAVYFLGIGGIGMSAIARYFLSRGVQVSGYDKTPTSLTKQLEEEGMQIHYEDNIELIDKNADIVVYTPAIPATHTELIYYRNHPYSLMKRSEVLGLITDGHYNICVGGTHGKTTTSAMVAHVLRHSGYGCNAFLGGIASNYDTNFWSSEKDVCVVEADEYDRSFLKLSPDVAIITAMDADHLDIYGTEEAMQDAFIAFTEKIKEEGLLIYKNGIARAAHFKADDKMSYGAGDETADVHSKNIKIKNGSYSFDVKIANLLIEDVTLNMGGMHNVENALAAIAVAYHVGIDVSDIKDEVITENQLLAEETKNFVPIHEILDDFKNEDTYSNVKEDFKQSIIDKNPVYRNVKPRIGKMIIDKETGERRIVHDNEVLKDGK
jgi:UDP-N-acetylmuramate--alanine ligase